MFWLLKFVFKLPVWLHELVLKVTGYRLVNVRNEHRDIEYYFTKKYPVSHPMDKKFPRSRNYKV